MTYIDKINSAIHEECDRLGMIFIKRNKFVNT